MFHLVRWGCTPLFFIFCVSSFLFAQVEQVAGDVPSVRYRVSPVLQIEDRRAGRLPLQKTGVLYRTIDGTGNNLENPLMGASFTQLVRAVACAYEDGVSQMAQDGRPDPRTVSNGMCSQAKSIPNQLGLTDFFWQWGQFVDHDIDLTAGTDPSEYENIAVPAGDPYFDPNGTGTAEMEFVRSVYDESTGTDRDNPRQQLNQITAWIDASNVYGSDEDRAEALRANDGTGRLKASALGLYLPYNVAGFPNAGSSGPELFLAGDVRANEQVGLTALHTLFMREHNRLAFFLKLFHPKWDDERIYQKARQLVGAQIQAITFNEFLPALLGSSLPPYQGYDPKIDASIVNLFSTAVYRFGHSALNTRLLRLDRNLEEIPEGHLGLRDAFFAPSKIIDEGGIDPILRGLANQACQEVDPFVVDDVRNFLFGPPGSGGFDLASLNIQRGRDHGLPVYNAARVAFGLKAAVSFTDISSDPTIVACLRSVYDNVDQVDLWIGALAEDHLTGAMVGELGAKVIAAQFTALRDGDRFWYTRVLSASERRFVESSTLAAVIRRNTGIQNEIPDDVFHLP